MMDQLVQEDQLKQQEMDDNAGVSDMDDGNAGAGNDMGAGDMNDVDGGPDVVDEGMGDMDDQGMDGQDGAEGQEDMDGDPDGEQFDYEQMDLRICGDLSMYNHYLIINY